MTATLEPEYQMSHTSLSTTTRELLSTKRDSSGIIRSCNTNRRIMITRTITDCGEYIHYTLVSIHSLVRNMSLNIHRQMRRDAVDGGADWHIKD